MCHIFAGQDPDDYEPETRRMRLNGQSTSIRLERSFWEIVDEIAASDGAQTVIKGYVERAERLTRDRPPLTLGLYVTTDSLYITAHPGPAPSPL